ncbi:MAG: bifunctional aminoglycoside phosphotransferase/ATP-binding protein [Alkalilacustris sp.]
MDEITAFLSDPTTHGGAAVDLRRTHGAEVYLAAGFAYKRKRPVRYSYLDFTDGAVRRAMLARELALNRPAAPEIYDRLVAVTRRPDGGLEFDGPGPAVEWVLRMRRFPQEAELARVAEAGGLDAPLAARLGEAVAALHAAAPARPGDGAARVAAVLSGLWVSFDGVAQGGDLAAARAVLAAAQARLARLEGLLDARAAAGFVRRCHGDLHLGNLVVLDGRPVPFDALEFDEALGTMDVLYDLAFLLMDLDRRGLRAAANAVLNRWLDRSGPVHLPGLAALPLFLALRATIRGLVALQRAEGARLAEAVAARAEAAACLAAAQGYLAPGPARLVAVGGLSGSGKSTLAAGLAAHLGPAPGAVLLRSDRIRKTLAGVAETERLPRASYTQAASDCVYAEMRGRAAQALAAGCAVVLDAVHLARAERAAARRLAEAAGVGFDGLWLDAPEAVLLDRVSGRRGDASDADAEVVRRQIAAAGAVTDWPHLPGAGAPEEVLRAALDRLGPGAQSPSRAGVQR